MNGWQRRFQPLMKARILELKSFTKVKTLRRMAARSMTETKISTMLSQGGTDEGEANVYAGIGLQPTCTSEVLLVA